MRMLIEDFNDFNNVIKMNFEHLYYMTNLQLFLLELFFYK